MIKPFIPIGAFAAGLAVLAWVGTGYLTTNPVAFAFTVLIAAFYLLGARELQRYRRDVQALDQAVGQLSSLPESPGNWLQTIPSSLRHAVRLRVEGDPVALPGPALTPQLVGLLVLLGMLGTFLGMVATLRGTGLALESVTDLEAIRASLAAPVKGLGFAFGTSVAGVATSAMLGLIAALCRREALDIAQKLDERIATVLRPWSRHHQRDEMFRLLQRQADTMPALVDRLDGLMATMARQNQALVEQLAAGQAAFHQRTETAYQRLADSVGHAMQASAAESARAAGAAIEPAVVSTMAALASESADWRARLSETVQQQMDAVAQRLDRTTVQVASAWQDALAGHQRTSEALASELRGSLAGFADTMAQRSAQLLDGMGERLDAMTARTAATWNDALAQQASTREALAQEHRQALLQASAAFEQQAGRLVDTVAQSHAELQRALTAGDTQRLAAWHDRLDQIGAALREQWTQAAAEAAQRQQAISDTLQRTAHEVASHTAAQADKTIAEVTTLVQVAAEAPRAAAEVIGELRQKLSDGIARDNAMLEERGRLLQTLSTLLDAVNHASTEQRAAVDALVGTTADLLDRVGTRFSEQVGAETDKLADVAAQVTTSAVEVASLGEALGAAVQAFGESNDKLMAQLQRIEGALDKSMARSDEQLAYYVAQAREVIDLSMLSQKQILEDLQRITARGGAATEAA